jgi:glycosyltransferase involved in cell wall biosynthesis
VRVETTVHALVTLGFAVTILEVSGSKHESELSNHARVRPAAPSIASDARLILGSFSPVAELRKQLALMVGLVANWRDIRSCDLVVVEGGLLWMALVATRMFAVERPMAVFDVHTVMSQLHRHGRNTRDQPCTIGCKLRRTIWRVLEEVCSRLSSVTIVCGPNDLPRFADKRVILVPHGVLDLDAARVDAEDPKLIGFVGAGRLLPNRAAVELLVSTVLTAPGLEDIRCRVIGDASGYSTRHTRLVFVGFQKVLAEALAQVSVVCAPMSQTGGVSTKVLVALACGKRTVCTPEAARGIVSPPAGLWVADFAEFPEAVAMALRLPWSEDDSSRLRATVSRAHGFDVVVQAWKTVIDRSPDGKRTIAETPY